MAAVFLLCFSLRLSPFISRMRTPRSIRRPSSWWPLTPTPFISPAEDLEEQFSSGLPQWHLSWCQLTAFPPSEQIPLPGGYDKSTQLLVSNPTPSKQVDGTAVCMRVGPEEPGRDVYIDLEDAET